MKKKVSVGTRLKQIMFEKNLKQVDILAKTAVLQTKYNVRIAKNDLSQYVNDKVEPNQERIFILAKALDVTEPWLMGFDVPRERHVIPSNIIPVDTTTLVKIPVLGTIACGEPLLAEENIEEYREEVADRLPKGDLFYLQANGDSMEPTIPNHSYVLIRQQPTVEDGEIAAVLVNGDTEATLKRIKRQGDSMMLVADNAKYPPTLVDADNPARIIGKAVKVETQL